MTNVEKRRVIAQLNGQSLVDAFEAAKAIAAESDKGLQLALIRTLKGGRRPFNRAAAAYAMQMLSTPKTIRALERTVTNKLEHPLVRGQAAEALAHNHRWTTHRILRTCLSDPSKHVRFWCSFALGEMLDEDAIPALERLAAADKRVVRPFHSVAREAADALQNIRNKKAGCLFCSRR